MAFSRQELRLTKYRFLLAKFQLDYVLREQSLRGKRKALTSLPASESEAYELIINRIKNGGTNTSDTAFRTLAWIFNAQRPLRMEELREALLIGEGVQLEEIPADDYPPNEIVQICESLIIHEEFSGIVRFSHTTVQDWLRESKTYENLPPPADLAQTCLTYLASNVFSEPCLEKKALVKRLEMYKFSKYAVQFWGFHTRGDAETRGDIQDAVLQTFGSELKRTSMLEIEEHKEYYNFKTGLTETLFHVVAKNGLGTICERLLEGR